MRMLGLALVLLAACTQSVMPGDGASAADANDTANDADASPSTDGPMCVGEYEPCVTRDDCCNGRHSCLRSVCQYSCAGDGQWCMRDEQCCNARQVCRSGTCQY